MHHSSHTTHTFKVLPNKLRASLCVRWKIDLTQLCLAEVVAEICSYRGITEPPPGLGSKRVYRIKVDILADGFHLDVGRRAPQRQHGTLALRLFPHRVCSEAAIAKS